VKIDLLIFWFSNCLFLNQLIALAQVCGFYLLNCFKMCTVIIYRYLYVTCTSCTVGF
jgi:hypothetical protein